MRYVTTIRETVVYQAVLDVDPLPDDPRRDDELENAWCQINNMDAHVQAVEEREILDATPAPEEELP